MLRAADHACFFRAPDRVADAHGDIPRVETYDELRAALRATLAVAPGPG